MISSLALLTNLPLLAHPDMSHPETHMERSNNSFIAHGAKPIATVVEVRLQ
jgi:hypothetical protein